MFSSKYFVPALAITMLAACAGGDDSPGNHNSLAGIMNAVESPTGTVDAATAPAVAVEYEKAMQGGSAVPKQQSGTQTQSCEGGGSFTASFSGNESNAQVNATYNDCCMSGCCINGTSQSFISGAEDAEYSICISMSVSAACDGLTAENLNYDMCLGSNGGPIFVIEIEGQTFAVSGNYNGGSGTLDIKGENGSFSCTFTNGTGSCTGDGGSFEF